MKFPGERDQNIIHNDRGLNGLKKILSKELKQNNIIYAD